MICHLGLRIGFGGGMDTIPTDYLNWNFQPAKDLSQNLESTKYLIRSFKLKGYTLEFLGGDNWHGRYPRS